MKKQEVSLIPLQQDDYDQFILDNQWAFKYGAMIEFGTRDDHMEEDGEIISRQTIEESIRSGEPYRIIYNGRKAGGVIIRVEKDHGDLDILFVSPEIHGRGIGQAAWAQVEKLHPEVRVWETMTPYFEKRNIHFYVNRCGFRIVEFFNSHHPGHGSQDEDDEMFRFEKRIED